MPVRVDAKRASGFTAPPYGTRQDRCAAVGAGGTVALMRDVLFLLGVVAFFTLAALFVRGCAWIIEAGAREKDAR